MVYIIFAHFLKFGPLPSENPRCTPVSNLLSRFRKKHNTQHCLLKMLEKWKEALDKGNFVDAIFMDLSKAFDILNHDRLIKKLEVYGLSITSLRFIRTKVYKEQV